MTQRKGDDEAGNEDGNLEKHGFCIIQESLWQPYLQTEKEDWSIGVTPPNYVANIR